MERIFANPFISFYWFMYILTISMLMPIHVKFRKKMQHPSTLSRFDVIVYFP